MSRQVSVSEISQHSGSNSLWLVVNGRVFDMTAFAPSHPGGAEIIYQYGGRDASEEYNAFHAPSLIAKSLDADCHIGVLDESTVTNEWRLASQNSINSKPDVTSVKPPLHSIVNLYDFEAVARQTLSRKAWAYINGASNDNITRDGNIELLKRVWLRPAVMRNVKTVQTKTSLFGCNLELPIYINPVGTVRLAGPEGEIAFAKAAASTGIMYCISTAASYPLDEILDATPGHAFFQLYVNKDRPKTEELLKKITASGKIKALLVTADLPVISKREDDERAEAAERVPEQGSGRKLGGIARENASFIDPELSWSDIAWIRSLTSLPIIIKGIQRWEDAKLAVQHGCQGIVISNHGGRAADTAQPAIVSLLELHKNCPEVFDSLNVLIDGGFRRGSDVVKAICLGASAVGFGRPLMYAAGYGTDGVMHAIDILREEVETAMRLCGLVDLARDASPQFINSAAVESLVHDRKQSFVRNVRHTKPRL